MSENYRQSLTLQAAAADVALAITRLARVPNTVIASDDEGREAINHLLTVLGARSTHLGYLELQIRCISAKVDSGTVRFTIVGETLEHPGSHAAGWKGCAEAFNQAILALNQELTQK